MAEIHLSDEDKAFINEQVKAGIYKDADAVVAAGLRLLGSDEGKVEELRHLIQQGIDDVDAGRVLRFESAEEMTAHILKMAEERKNEAASSQDIARGAERSSRHV
ncbi:type II toxin-antitoxin system ParD family antitoxin [Neorhizobium alkalisoli]|uniref:Antitoxin ParD1/3/4 n=1 Tax=Neorhizobium alkalisoli TaxID=528178 RepID=A0A561R2I9_9HYPH|nr:type II toxin-antitoxin system ParD family antitoxin [Neorhizobium alkalisoli]TWF56832.1 antitoxin ParD1/3/4 [Neorhizobium alkalisoli]